MLVAMNVALGTIEQTALVSVQDKRKQLWYVDGSACMARQKKPIPECMVNGTEYYDGQL